ncbi:MAG TPA: YceI family protein [Acetobacteraceae bacterium]|jgi:polyisoprenoid-binding protein YceI|nr:YceI family protein [Acetobacteraceae bacterium]
MKSLWLIAWLVVAASHAACAADLFNLDQRYGSIGFSVTNFGTFSSLGSFPRFMGKLLIDRSHPEQTKIDVQADATSIQVPWDSGTELLRGPDFFDIAHYPHVRYVSDAIRGVDPHHFLIQGVLEIRGVRRPLTLDATLEREHTNMANGNEIADFSVTGTLNRSDYGMTSQRIMISDQVTLQIAARIELPPQTK